MQTTAPPTGTALVAAATTTLIQVQTPSSRQLRVVEWGVAFNQVLATPAVCELIDTSTIAATVTAYATTVDVVRFNAPNDELTQCPLGTAQSGFNATAEGASTSVRTGDVQQVVQQYLKQFPLGREFEVPVSHNLRVRVTSAAAVTALAYVVWEE